MQIHAVALVFFVIIVGFSANAEDCRDKPQSNSLKKRILLLESRFETLEEKITTLTEQLSDFETDEGEQPVSDSTPETDEEDPSSDTVTNERNRRFFRGGSLIYGRAVLENSQKQGSSRDLINLMGVQVLLRSVNDDTAGFGFFGAVDLEGVSDGTVNFAGFGLAISSRLENAGHPITIGAGYGIDRVAKSNSEDRTGFFILFSFNPPSTTSALVPKFKEIFIKEGD